MSIVVVDASTGASAVIVEQVQGPPGTLASPSGTGVVLALSGAIVGAASLGSAYQTLQTNSAGTNVTWGAVWISTVQSCSAGGTIASTATTGVGIIVLTGSPSAAFTYQLPTGAGAYQIVNNAGQYCTITSSGSGAQLIQPAGNMFVSTDGTTVYSPVAPPSVQRYTTASSSKQILISVPGQPQSVSIDTSSGAVTCAAPVMANVTDGQVFECKDVTCYWGTNQAALTTESGISIENPQSLGTYIAHGTTLNLLKLNGSGNAWRAYKTESKWACIY